MENVEALNCCQVRDKLSSTNQNSESIEIQNQGEQEHCHGEEEWGESSPIIYQDGPSKESQQHSLSGRGILNELMFDILSPPYKSSSKDIVNVAIQELSAEEIMKIAGERFISSSTQTVENLNNHLDISEEDAKKVELAQLLLASADKVSTKQFDCANKLLDQCNGYSSTTGNAVQRIVYYFSKALRERINRETGRITLEDLDKLQFIHLDEAIVRWTPILLACYLELPFFQPAIFSGIQTIAENVSNAERIHVIDIGIKIGGHLAVLMQALASRSVSYLKLLKITAIGTTKKRIIEQTGKRLEKFAQSLKIPFCFKLIMVSDMIELKESLFELDAGETVVVYSACALRSLISLPDRLDTVMKVLKNLNPIIMVVTEAEVNTSSTSFVNRFIESLFYYSAYFDSTEACMGSDPNRIMLESSYFAAGIRNIIASEGGEMNRNAKLDVWRAFFARFGMEEIELSTEALFQADMVAKKFACGKYCTIEINGKSLLIGWKGTPLQALSTWRFSN